MNAIDLRHYQALPVEAIQTLGDLGIWRWVQQYSQGEEKAFFTAYLNTTVLPTNYFLTFKESRDWVYGSINSIYKDSINWKSCKIIFLDLDGVLNYFGIDTRYFASTAEALQANIQPFVQYFVPDYLAKLYCSAPIEPRYYLQRQWIDQDKLKLLLALQEQEKDLYFVISSNWRLTFSLEVFSELLLYPLRILGKTSALSEIRNYHSDYKEDQKLYRSDEVRYWLSTYHPEATYHIAMLDDDEFLYSQDAVLQKQLILTDIEYGLLPEQQDAILETLNKPCSAEALKLTLTPKILERLTKMDGTFD